MKDEGSAGQRASALVAATLARQRTGKPVEYNPKLDVQIYNPEARALRGDGQKRSCPTWHGGVAHQPMAYNPVKGIAYGVGTEGCFSQNGASVGSLGKDGGIDNKTSQRRTFSSDIPVAVTMSESSCSPRPG